MSSRIRPLLMLCAAAATFVMLTGAACTHQKKDRLIFFQLPTSVAGKAAGASFTFDIQVENIGNKTSGGFKVQAYLSIDGTFDAGSITAIGSSAVQPGLTKGNHTTVTVSATVPPLYPAGEAFIFVQLPNGAAASMRFPVLVSTTTPDFTVVTLGLGKTVLQRGTSVLVNWNIANLGSGTGTVKNGFFLGLGPTHTGADRYLGMDVAPNYTPGSSYETDALVTIPGDIAPGQYYFILTANYDGAVTEVDNFNNSISIPVIVNAYAGIDYVVGNQDKGDPIIVGQGTTFTVTQTAANAGTLDADTGVEVGAYLMGAPGYAWPGGLLVGATATNLLTAGTTQTLTFNVTMPPALPPGTYYLGYYIDDLNFEPESNEYNNGSLTVPVTVVADDYLENNDTQAEANALAKATVYSPLESLLNDDDWYRITVGGFTNQITTTVTNTVPGEVTCSVYDGLGNLLGNGAATGTGWSDTLTQLKAGNYYFRCVHTNVNTFSTDYTFRADSIEQPAVLVTTSGTLTVDQITGNVDTYTVALSRTPKAGETVTLTLTFDSAHLNVSPTTINFDNTNYTTPVTISVSAVNTATPGTHVYPIHTAITTTDGTSDYNSALAADLNVNVTD